MVRALIKLLIRFYQLGISPFLGKNCRFYPSCSEYCMLCMENLPIHKALWYSTVRIFKCNPFHSGGLDEPPVNALEEVK